MSSHITIGVAGHVDHGKTALVRALTGIETDRLKEEQERGMSIVLGFAHLELPGARIDFIDVPGHERFIKTMISGATGVDAALLVVAANERVKPQTIEHVELLELLGVRRGIIAVTKCDLLESGEQIEVEAAARAFASGTFLQDAPVVFTSSLTGEGLDELNSTIEGLSADAVDQTDVTRGSYVYLPIDRVFTVAGHGTVVTGTLRRGALSTNTAVEIVPRGARAGIRGLEVHGHAAQMSEPGWRTAVNLRGLDKDEVVRGDALASPGFLLPTRRVDAELTLLQRASKPLRRGQNVLLYYATTEIMARAYPLGHDAIEPGDTGYVQFRLTHDIAVPAGEPFVIRSYAPVETIGGGRIVDPNPHGQTRRDAAGIRRLDLLAHGSVEDKILARVEEAGRDGVEISRLAMDFGGSIDAFPTLLSMAPAVAICGSTAVSRPFFDDLCRTALTAIEEFHASQRLAPGIARDELRRKVHPRLSTAIFEAVLDGMRADGRVETAGTVVRRPGYSPEAMLTEIETRIAAEIEGLFRECGLKPPRIKDVVNGDRRKKSVFRFLLDSGILFAVEGDSDRGNIVFHREAIDQAAATLERRLTELGGATVSEIDALLGTTRKFSIPLLAHFDKIGVTRRQGDVRVSGNEIGASP